MHNQEITIEIMPPTNQVVWPIENNLSKKQYHCLKCQKVFSTSNGLKSHSTADKCQSSICGQDHIHELIDSRFNSIAEAKARIFDQELDKIFVVVGSREDNIRYQCRQRDMSRNSNPKEHESKTKRRNRKPINRCACAASLNIRKIRLCYCENPESNPFCEKFQTQFQLLGCLTHSHRPQKQFLRIPKVKRDMLLSLMEIGVPKKVILDKYCSSENLDETEGKIVTLKDLDNFEKHHRKFRKTSGPPRLQKVPCQECKLSQPNSCPHDPMVVLTLDKFSNEDHDYCSTNVMIPVPKLDDKSNQSDRNHQFEPTDIEAVETESSAHKDFELRKTRILKELDSHLGQVGAARGEKLLHKLSDINGEAKAFLTERAKRPKSQGREEHGHPEPLNLLNEDAVRILLDNPFVVNEMIEPVEDQYA